VTHNLRWAPDIATDDRKACRHRLNDRHAKSLNLPRELSDHRMQSEHIGNPAKLSALFSRHSTQEINSVSEHGSRPE
jgi:hypothetical protein